MMPQNNEMNKYNMGLSYKNRNPGNFASNHSNYGPPGVQISQPKNDNNFSRINQQKNTIGRYFKNKNIPTDDRSKVINPYTPYFNKNHAKNSKQNNLNKQERLGKYQEKRRKANEARQKKAETIVIDSNSDDNDNDVIVIPVPPPPLVTIDSSDDEQSNFVQPLAKTNVQKQCDNTSISTNPPSPSTSSVFSDDFIIQNDRNRLKTSFNTMLEGNDDELNCDQQTVDSVVNQMNDNFSSNQSTKEKDIAKQKESVLNTNDTSGTSQDLSLPNNNPSSLSVGSDKITNTSDKQITEQNNKLSAKKLSNNRKRKSIQNNSDSSDCDEDDYDLDIDDTKTKKKSFKFPFKSGSAIENTLHEVKVHQKKKKSILTNDTSSDEHFISILSQLVEGENESDDEWEIEDADIDIDIDIEKEPNTEENKDIQDNSPIQIEDESSDKVINEKVTDNSELVTLLDSDCDYIDVDEIIKNHENNLSNKEIGVKRKYLPLVDDLPEISWNNEMKRFYHDSWGGEDFNVNKIKSAMDASKKSWRVSGDDLLPYVNKHYTKLRCRNCNEIGHYRNQCPLPFKKIVCNMCGIEGHSSSRCPNPICLQCGAETNIYSDSCRQCTKFINTVCNICKVKGHPGKNCPDIWRRYHSTVTDNGIVNDKVQYSNKKFCSICAKRGHTADKCYNALRIFSTPIAKSTIVSHKPIYENSSNNKESNLTDNDQNRNNSQNCFFKWDEKTLGITDQSFYGRFVNAIKKQNKEEIEKKRNQKIINKNIPENESVKIIDEVEPQQGSNGTLLLNPFACLNKSSKLSPNKRTSINDFSFVEELDKLNQSKSTENSENETSLLNNSITDTIESITNTNINYSSNVILNKPSPETDSNYSFSDFYKDDNGSINKNLTKPKFSFPTSDFIPLDSSNNDKNNEENLNDKKIEQNCSAKIFLSKNDIQFILSFDGKKNFEALKTKFNVKVMLQWSSLGCNLLIEGPPSEQDLFHHDLIKFIRDSQKDLKKKQLEKSLQVPKHKLSLINFIEKQLALLKLNLGDVKKLHRRLCHTENFNTKNSIKIADTTRRLLNMILIGQAGLCDGKKHLNAIQNILESLKNDEDITVTQQLRNELFEHIKYIFTPYEHLNYKEMINEYLDIKQIEEMRKNSETSINFVIDKNPATQNRNCEFEENELSGDIANEEPIITPNPPLDIEIDHIESTNNNENIEITNSQPSCSNLLSNTFNSEIDNTKTPTVYWSKKCIDMVDECRKLCNIVEKKNIFDKLNRVYEKAFNYQLNELDYQALLQVLDLLKNNK